MTIRNRGRRTTFPGTSCLKSSSVVGGGWRISARWRPEGVGPRCSSSCCLTLAEAAGAHTGIHACARADAMSLRLAPSGNGESASLRRRLRDAHGSSPVDAQAQYAERIRRRLEAALEPPSPTSPRSPSAWNISADLVGSEHSFASSASARPAWDGSPKTDGWRPASARSRSPVPARGYSPTRETWFGAPNKDFSLAACEKEARELAQAGAQARAAQKKRVEQMALVSKSSISSQSLAHSPKENSTTEWGGTARSQRRRTSISATQAFTSPVSRAAGHTHRSSSNRSPSPRQIPAKPVRRRVNMDAAPAGWETATSQTTGSVYYINTLTGESTYGLPTAPAAATMRSRAGGRSGEDWASDVLSQLDRSSAAAPTQLQERDAQQAEEKAWKDAESYLQEQVKSAAKRELAAQEAARRKAIAKEVEKREKEQAKMRATEQKAAEKAARERIQAEKQAAQKQAAAEKQKAQERAAAEKRAALDQPKALRPTAKANTPAPEPSSAVSPLPAGWEEHRSESTGEVYWLSTVTWEHVFVRPTAPASEIRAHTEAQSDHSLDEIEETPADAEAEADVDLRAQALASNVQRKAATSNPTAWQLDQEPKQRIRETNEMPQREIVAGMQAADGPQNMFAGETSQVEPEPEPEQEPQGKKKTRKVKEVAKRQTAAEKKAAEKLEKVRAAEEEEAMLEQAAKSFSSTLSLPAGWEEARSRSSGEVYYRNLFTGESTYDFPTYPADAGNLVPDQRDELTSAGSWRAEERTDNADTDVGLTASGRFDSSATTEDTGATNDIPPSYDEHIPAFDSDSALEGSEPRTNSAESKVPAVLSPNNAAAERQPVPSSNLDSLCDDLTIYLASGKKKHPRIFWLTPPPDSQSQNGPLLHWGKKQNGRQAKVETLLRVVDKPTIPDAERLFYDMDDDDSGYLDATEVAQLYKKARGEKLSKSSLAAAMREMDSDGNNQVTMDEFQTWWVNNGGDLEQHRDRAFTFVCEGGTEVLVVAKDMETKSRWVRICTQMLPAAAPDNLTNAPSGLLTMYHATGQKKHSRFFWMNAESGKISWGKALRSKSCKTETLLRVIDAPSVPDARDLFRQIDRDGSGYLDSTEVAALYKKARGERLAGKKLKEAMTAMDSDGNNQVSLPEFEAWWASNGGDLEQHRARAMTFVCVGGIELLVVAPDSSTKRRWLKACSRLGLLEQVNKAVLQDTVPMDTTHTDAARLQQIEETLPDGWETATSQRTGETYYINALTGESTYEMPTAPAYAVQTELHVMTPAAPAEMLDEPPATAASSQDHDTQTAALAKQAEKESKKLQKEEAKRAKKAAKDQAKAQKAKKNKKSEEPPAPDLAALAKDLPAGWEPAISRSSGEVYYINLVSGDSTYDRPSEPAFTDSFLSTAGAEAADGEFFTHGHAPLDAFSLNCLRPSGAARAVPISPGHDVESDCCCGRASWSQMPCPTDGKHVCRALQEKPTISMSSRRRAPTTARQSPLQRSRRAEVRLVASVSRMDTFGSQLRFYCRLRFQGTVACSLRDVDPSSSSSGCGSSAAPTCLDLFARTVAQGSLRVRLLRRFSRCRLAFAARVLCASATLPFRRVHTGACTTWRLRIPAMLRAAGRRGSCPSTDKAKAVCAEAMATLAWQGADIGIAIDPSGPTYLYATNSEHHVETSYRFDGASNIFFLMGQNEFRKLCDVYIKRHGCQELQQHSHLWSVGLLLEVPWPRHTASAGLSSRCAKRELHWHVRSLP